MPTVIGNIGRLPPGSTGANVRGDPGELVIDGDTIEFRGKKDTVRFTDVRAVTREGNTGRVVVAYGTPEATERFYVLHSLTTAKGKALVEQLRSALGLGAAGGTDQPVAVHRARMRAARNRILISALFLAAGLVVTIYTVSRAFRQGGTYFVAWGAILFGAVYLVVGLVEYSKAAAAVRAAGGTPDASERKPDVPALRAARNVDGLVTALRHDDLQTRVDVMNALQEMRDPRAVDLLIVALRDPRWDVRWSAAEALGKLGDPRAVEPLRGVTNDDNAMVRAVADASIAALLQPSQGAPQPRP